MYQGSYTVVSTVVSLFRVRQERFRLLLFNKVLLPPLLSVFSPLQAELPNLFPRSERFIFVSSLPFVSTN